VFLADLSRRVTDTTRCEASDAFVATAHATAAWFDFLDGWVGNIKKELVRPSTLRQTSGSLPTPAPTPAPPAQYGGPTPGTGPQGPPNKRAAVGNTSGGGGGGGTPCGGGGGGGAPAPGSTVLPSGRMCDFQRNFPRSPSIVGSTLGVAAAPPCKLCALSNHFHGECPKEWPSKLGKVLPGFVADGTRIQSV
jgi:hypothetical protein